MMWRDDIHADSALYKVSIHRGEWVDQSRNGRRIPYKVYVPRDLEGPLPTVIWSHGLGGSRDGAGFISRFLAEHGYCVINIQHVGTDVSLWMGKEGHPWDVIRATEITWQMTYDRLMDMPYVFNALEQDNLIDQVKGKIDLTRVGMSGHSYGAYTTQVVSGQKFRDGDGGLTSLGDNLIKVSLAYSPSYTNVNTNPEAIYGGIQKPIFFMTGTNDSSPLTGTDYTYGVKVFEYSGSMHKKLLVLNEADHMVFAGSRGQLEAYDKMSDHQDMIKLSALAWWDAHLKEDSLSQDWLESGFENWIGSEGFIK